MGITYIEGKATGRGKRSRSVKFLVDSGAMYSLLPKKVWQEIGLKPKRRVTFALADGTTVEHSVSEARLALPQGEAHTPVVLGEAGDRACSAP